MPRKKTTGVTLSLTDEERRELQEFSEALGLTTRKPAVMAAVRFSAAALKAGKFTIPPRGTRRRKPAKA